MHSLEERIKTIYENSQRDNVFSEEQISTLRWLERQTHTRTNHAQMLVGEEEGRFLAAFTQEIFLTSKSNSFKILEIGTFTGYSLLCFSFALKSILQNISHSAPDKEFPLNVSNKDFPSTASNKDFSINAIEINDELKYLIDEAVAKAEAESFVKVCFADALEYLQSHRDELYDIIFIDANKRNYLEYYKLVFPLLKRGGFILADNVLWHGKLPDASQSAIAECGNLKTRGILDFNSYIAKESEAGKVESYLLPIRDGLYIISKP